MRSRRDRRDGLAVAVRDELPNRLHKMQIATATVAVQTRKLTTF